MKLHFTKYHGTGNDFIMVDNRNGIFPASEEIIIHLCDRHFGIGADGFITLETADNFDFRMTYFNADGKEGTMCGNGGRCCLAFALHLGLIRNRATFKSIDGVHQGEILKIAGDQVISKVKLKNVSRIEMINGHYFIDTGSPHYVIFTKNIEQQDVLNEGRKLRYSEPFHPDGTNVDFAQIFDDHIFVRTYERGVETETLSCGTGVTASMLATWLYTDGLFKHHHIATMGGSLKVTFKPTAENRFEDIWLEGPAQKVFSGTIEI